MIASHFGVDTVVKLLLEGNVDVNAKSNFGYPPLFEAMESGHEAIVKLLPEDFRYPFQKWLR
jgi:ankyrin repeat protein